MTYFENSEMTGLGRAWFMVRTRVKYRLMKMFCDAGEMLMIALVLFLAGLVLFATKHPILGSLCFVALLGVGVVQI